VIGGWYTIFTGKTLENFESTRYSSSKKKGPGQSTEMISKANPEEQDPTLAEESKGKQLGKEEEQQGQEFGKEEPKQAEQ